MIRNGPQDITISNYLNPTVIQLHTNCLSDDTYDCDTTWHKALSIKGCINFFDVADMSG